mmetsp:Transcript_2829/g.4668  ORF Transcript_2829/g.4668 Transcript_2829/m.4668 type:complete len:140 (+) Transcript_2829:98-517(+)
MSSFRASASMTSFRGTASLSSRAGNSTAMSFMPSFGRRRSKDSDDSGSAYSQELMREKGRELANQEVLLLQQQHDLSEQLQEQKAQIDQLQELQERLSAMVAEQEMHRRNMAGKTSSESETSDDVQGYVDDDGFEVTSV